MNLCVFLLLLAVSLLQLAFHQSYSYNLNHLTNRRLNFKMSTDSNKDLSNIEVTSLNNDLKVDIIEPSISEENINETPEEKFKREKLQEIADRKAAEVFVTRDTGKYECQSCGYVYDSSIGLPKKGVLPGTPFDEIEKFRCPQCGASKKYFVAEQETLSGFKENLKFGLGGNAMTASQKSNLIFGGLALGFIIFLSGYLLE